MRVLITGSSGMLGRELAGALTPRMETVGLDRAEEKAGLHSFYACDISNLSEVRKVMRDAACDWVIHGAAMTDVDGCEREPRRAEMINREGTRHVAESASECGMRGIMIGTDFVFDGKKTTPYEENDSPNPLGVYGRTKREAETFWHRCLPGGTVLRTSWLFGHAGNNFVRAITRKLERGEPLSVVGDQWGAVTYAPDLAEAIRMLMDAVQTGRTTAPPALHFTNSGATSRYEWACYIARELGYRKDRIKPIQTKDSGRLARRPMHGVLSTSLWCKLFKTIPRDVWTVTSEYLRSEASSLT